MRFQFSFKHMEVSPSLQRYAEDKIHTVVGKFITKPIEATVTFSVERHLHTVHCDIAGGDGFSVSVNHSCEDMYGSVDRVIDKLATQLKRKKDKMKEHKGRQTFKSKYNQSGDYQDDYEVDADDIIKYEQARRKMSAGA